MSYSPSRNRLYPDPQEEEQPNLYTPQGLAWAQGLSDQRVQSDAARISANQKMWSGQQSLYDDSQRSPVAAGMYKDEADQLNDMGSSLYMTPPVDASPSTTRAGIFIGDSGAPGESQAYDAAAQANAPQMDQNAPGQRLRLLTPEGEQAKQRVTFKSLGTGISALARGDKTDPRPQLQAIKQGYDQLALGVKGAQQEFEAANNMKAVMPHDLGIKRQRVEAAKKALDDSKIALANHVASNPSLISDASTPDAAPAPASTSGSGVGLPTGQPAPPNVNVAAAAPPKVVTHKGKQVTVTPMPDGTYKVQGQTGTTQATKDQIARFYPEAL